MIPTLRFSLSIDVVMDDFGLAGLTWVSDCGSAEGHNQVNAVAWVLQGHGIACECVAVLCRVMAFVGIFMQIICASCIAMLRMHFLVYLCVSGFQHPVKGLFYQFIQRLGLHLILNDVQCMCM